MRFSVFPTARAMHPSEDAAIIDATIAHAHEVEALGYDAQSSQIQAGDYEIMVGRSFGDIRLHTQVTATAG